MKEQTPGDKDFKLLLKAIKKLTKSNKLLSCGIKCTSDKIEVQMTIIKSKLNNKKQNLND